MATKPLSPTDCQATFILLVANIWCWEKNQSLRGDEGVAGLAGGHRPPVVWQSLQGPNGGKAYLPCRGLHTGKGGIKSGWAQRKNRRLRLQRVTEITNVVLGISSFNTCRWNHIFLLKQKQKNLKHRNWETENLRMGKHLMGHLILLMANVC